MNQWAFHNPVRLHFGEGVLDHIGEALMGRCYLLITHPGTVTQIWSERIVELCGSPLWILNTVAPNPTLEALRHLSAEMLKIGRMPEAIVAIGGGSVIDSAKFLAAGQGDFHAVLGHMETGQHLSGKALPIIAIPTTAGTGSDLTKWATAWDIDGKRKLSLEHDDLYPEASLVDPILTHTQPWPVTLASGLDALSHALESIWNINANPVTRGFAVAAARDVLEALPQLLRNPECRNARTQMAMGATRAGLAFSNTRTALAHNISYPLTIELGVPHGIACSFYLPEVMQAAIGADAACDAALAEIFRPLAQAPARLRALLDELGVPREPKEFGIESEQWMTIVRDAIAGTRGKNFIGLADKFC